MAQSNNEKYDVFISYRNEGPGPNYAQWMLTELTLRGYSAFMADEHLRSGKFDDQLYSKIHNAKDFLLILTNDCLKRCINSPDDWVYKEVAHAVHLRKNVIPVPFDGFLIAEKNEYPKEINTALGYHGIEIPKHDKKSAIDKLCTLLISKPRKKTLKWFGYAAGILLTIALAVILYFILSKPIPPPLPLPEPYSITGNFFPSGWLGDAERGSIFVTYDPNYNVNPHSGNTCIRISYSKDKNGQGWAGIYWQYPENNWGEQRGKNLAERRYTKITFYARSDQEGQRATFKSGGINKTFSDSFAMQSITVELTPLWRQFSIPLKNADLSNVIGAFGWSSDASVTVYLDDIQFE